LGPDAMAPMATKMQPSMRSKSGNTRWAFMEQVIMLMLLKLGHQLRCITTQHYMLTFGWLVSDVCLVNQSILACLVHAPSYDAITEDSHALAAKPQQLCPAAGRAC